MADVNLEDRALQLDSFFLPSGGTNHGHERPSSDWLAEPEFPTTQSLTANKEPELLWTPNDQIQCKSEYLQKQYLMQRYEAVEPTRQAIANFQTRPDRLESDFAYIYTNVQTQGFVLTAHGAAARVSFSTDGAPDSPVDWVNSGRLRQGSLVVISPINDLFRSECHVATVAYRFLSGGLWPDIEAGEPGDTPPRVDLYFTSWSKAFIDPEIKYYMLEAKEGYFESFRHTMIALQNAASELSLFDKYVLTQVAREQEQFDPVKIFRHTPDVLDKSQAAARESIIVQELAVVQGPPGTGKTHTTVATIETIVSQSHSKIPILVAAQTNHALDQLLERLEQKGLAICRLGGRTTSENIEQYSLFNIRQNQRGMTHGPRIAGVSYKDYETSLQVLELYLKKVTRRQINYDSKLFRDAGIITAEQYESLQNGNWETSAELDPLLPWLGWESFEANQDRTKPTAARAWPKAMRNEDGEVEKKKKDPDKPIGPYIRLGKYPRAPPSARLKSILSRTQNLYKVKFQHREELFRYMCNEIVKQSEANIEQAFEKFKAACERLQRQKTRRDEMVIRKAKIQIIGCTITGLSKYRALLSLIGPEVLIIDEASEATEGSIAAALFPSLKHLSLVGDHQQLTPRPIHKKLLLPEFAMDVSLFERLITNGMPYKMLNTQRRMIPEIRQLVNIFYPELEDHSSVRQREKIKGIDSSLWWFDHAWPEQVSSGPSNHSFCNNAEADMIVNFAKYLVRCGTPVAKLTILTFYTGQQQLIQSKLGEWSPDVCRTVDSFQGCENDVIILSIVRSPGQGRARNAGFVDNIHRATVALSRARNALYIFGNAINLYGSATWTGVLNALHESTAASLPLVCPIHGTRTSMQNPGEWTAISSDAGCHGNLCEGVAEARMGAGESIEMASFQKPKDGRRDDGASSTGTSQNSAAHSSEYLMEVGYDAFLAEFDSIAVSARERLLSGEGETQVTWDGANDLLISFE